MRLARHPHVMRLEELYEDINAVHLVMPLVARGDLKAIMATGDADCWGENNARKILRPLCSAVAYLHELGVVPGQAFTLKDFAKRVPWRNVLTLHRVYLNLASIFEELDQDRPRVARARAVQGMKALHQVALDRGV